MISSGCLMMKRCGIKKLFKAFGKFCWKVLFCANAFSKHEGVIWIACVANCNKQLRIFYENSNKLQFETVINHAESVTSSHSIPLIYCILSSRVPLNLRKLEFFKYTSNAIWILPRENQQIASEVCNFFRQSCGNPKFLQNQSMPIDFSVECLDDYAKLYNKFNGFAIARKGVNDCFIELITNVM